MNRRQFLGSVSASAVFTMVPRHVLGGAGNTPPSRTVNVAGIGIGSMGASNLKNLREVNITALCDVDEVYAAKTFAQYPGAKRYTDYRVMLETQKDIDAVIIATPDHTHAVIAMAAMRAGKHVYCQKPLTHNIEETRKLVAAARELKVVTQMGIQGHSRESTRILCEWIWDGAIGPVREVIAWSSLSYYPWGHANWSPKCSERPRETADVPSTLDWDLWLGPADRRPYHPCYHPRSWRAWRDFGCGMLGDRGVHSFDPIFWALDLKYPQRVEANSLGGNEETFPLASIVTYHFPARGEKPPVKLVWYDGMVPPRPDDLEEGRQWGGKEGGILFVGEKGKLMCDYTGESPRIIPEAKMKEYKKPEPTLRRIAGTHEMEWIRAIQEGGKTEADFEYAGPLTEAVLLGNLAGRVAGAIAWDGPAMKITNHKEANQYLRRSYRQGWSL